tara:strand:+ start:1628 stop:2284 length:657 start_codon:yes stop_codon:yes gene_type:complete
MALPDLKELRDKVAKQKVGSIEEMDLSGGTGEAIEEKVQESAEVTDIAPDGDPFTYRIHADGTIEITSDSRPGKEGALKGRKIAPGSKQHARMVTALQPHLPDKTITETSEEDATRWDAEDTAARDKQRKDQEDEARWQAEDTAAVEGQLDLPDLPGQHAAEVKEGLRMNQTRERQAKRSMREERERVARELWDAGRDDAVAAEDDDLLSRLVEKTGR